MDRNFTVLEYDKILDLLSERTSGVSAAREVLKLLPSSDEGTVNDRQAETSEAVLIVKLKGSPPIGEYGDVRRDATYARKGGSLTPAGLLAISVHLSVVRSVKAFLNLKDEANHSKAPIIEDIANLLTPDKDLEVRIQSSIISESEIADSASSELRRIRREKLKQSEGIRNHLNKLITSQTYKDVLQDQLVTIRDGRYVIPVKQEYRQKVAGLVHDQSKGGATVFIEPQAVVDMNNKLRELELEEEREIERILAELSSMVGSIEDAILLNHEMLIKLDIIFAKGKLSLDMGGTEPIFAKTDGLVIEAGRHPLIDKNKIVPVSILLDGNVRTMIITGPNTGGKTVTLKTVGLFILMTKAGLHVPAEKAEIPKISDVFADIGDEQSIEQSLSTFSSHMKNIVSIINTAQSDSCILLDELGAGTDPSEGAALAISILDNLSNRRSYVFATTHYTELKKYALSEETAVNASMEFDVDTLSPTYKLRIGTPGRSNAFEISRKLGLPDPVIAGAEAQMSGDVMRFDDVIGSIEDDRLAAERDREEAEAAREEIERIRQKLEKKYAAIDERRDAILSKAREKAAESIEAAEEYAAVVKDELRAILDDARDDIDSEERKGGYYKRIDDGKKLLRGLAEDVEDSINRIPAKNSKHKGRAKTQSERSMTERKQKLSISDIKPGDTVRLSEPDCEAEVLTSPDDKGEITVQAGRLKLTVNVKSVTEHVTASDMKSSKKQSDDKNTRSAASNIVRSKVGSITSSVNVIGQNLDDAKLTVNKYLDDASLAGLPSVTIIHGLGAGILRDGLRPMLRKHKLVKSIRSGGQGEGGEGATVVVLK